MAVVGGSGFMLSAILLMLEVQTRWWKPALSDIGWHSVYLICHHDTMKNG